MSCDNHVCQLNDALLALLPTLTIEQQQHVLQAWPFMHVEEREVLLIDLDIPAADLVALAKLAEFFECGVYDVMRYTQPDSTSDE